MKKFGAEATLAAMNLSEEERIAIINAEAKLTTTDNHAKVELKKKLREDRATFETNHKIMLEEEAEQHYKNMKAPSKNKDKKNSKGIEVKDHCEVIDTMPGAKFKVKVGEDIIICYLSGRLRENRIKVGKGNHVQVEMSVYGKENKSGRITWRQD